jgi:hypothetical protein
MGIVGFIAKEVLGVIYFEGGLIAEQKFEVFSHR